MRQILILAIAYGAAGQMARVMAIPPGYATAIWPAAGIALAGLLLWGGRAFPGVILGSMLANLPATFNRDELLASLVLPFTIGCGAALQALAGTALVRRAVGFPNSLHRERDIGLLMLLGGPVSCVIGPTLATLVLWQLGRVPTGALALHWWTWWGGDVIGVFLATPVMLLWFGERQADWPRRPLTVTGPLAMLALLAVGLFAYADAMEKERQHIDFETQTEALARAVENRLDRIQESLYSLRRDHGGHPRPGDGSPFKRLASETLQRRPGIHAFAWVTRIQHADRSAFEKAQLQQRGQDYTIRELNADGQFVTATDRTDYYPIYFRQPELQDAIGFDVGSEGHRLEALRQAARTGEPVASLPIPFLPGAAKTRGPEEKGILIFLAVYRDDILPEAIEAREAAVVGYVIAVLKVSQLVEMAWTGLPSKGLQCWFVGDAGAPDQGLALLPGDAEFPEVVPASTELARNVPIRSAGQRWTLRFVRTAPYAAAQQSLQPWAVLAGGMLFTGLLGNVLLGVTGRSTVIAEVVEQRTAELARANAAMVDEIRERNQVEEALRTREESLLQSDERFRQLVDGTRDYAILMLDREGKIVSWNPGAQRINGYEAGEVIGRHWSIFHLPEDVDSGKRANVLAVAERDGRWEDEGWRVRKNGERYWANDIITALHDSNGQPRGFLKITRDITERKRAETELEESRRLVQRIAETLPNFLYVYDLQEQRNIFMNHGLETILGYTRAEAERCHQGGCTDHIHPDDRSKFDWADEQYQLVEDNDVVELEYRMRHANGDWRWLRCRNTVFARDPDGSARQVLGTAQDITERKRLEQEVVDIAAQEQRRIGQELHDGTGQELTGLCMLADNLGDALREPMPAEEQRARRIAQGLRQTLAQVRALARGLIPVEVDAEGLMVALGELASRVNSVYPIRCVFECKEPVPVEDNYSATQLYRIAQEAITNAVKHGQARNIRVSLEANGYYITLRVSDDGVGLKAAGTPTEGMGFKIMRYRAGQIGAQFSVRAVEPRGTMVVCTLVRGSCHD